jgi:DNA polymerase elongation subunit (family B)
LENKIVPEKDGYNVSENERYVGAYVFPPKPGLYENVVSLDFSGLYPSLIIAYNIDYSTCAFDPSIPDKLCHVMEWEDHIACKHDPKVIEKKRLTKAIDELTSQKGYDKEHVSILRKQRSDITKSLNKNVMCEKRKYRFLKTEEYPEFKGVLPTIVQYLLDSRKETRKEMGRLKSSLKTIDDEHKRKEVETTISILNQRQLAYKVSANSMYGITGVKAGMLPFMPVAMSITFMGRTNIMKVADVIQNKYDGTLVYGDTDSNYVSFDHKNFTTTELWDYAIKVADEISALFPPPMKIEFEEAVYTKFLLLTKKRYMYQAATRDGTIKPQIGKKGVVLNRRDNSAFIRNTYENMVRIIFENKDSIDTLQTKVISSLINDINSMFSHELPVDHFTITKSTGDYGNLQPQYFLNEKGLHRAMLGQYNVPFLTDEIKMAEGIATPRDVNDWYLDKLPAHIQLLEKIRRRGHIRN